MTTHSFLFLLLFRDGYNLETRAHFEVDDVDNNKINRTEDRKKESRGEEEKRKANRRKEE
jgi:hypothetical protein